MYLVVNDGAFHVLCQPFHGLPVDIEEGEGIVGGEFGLEILGHLESLEEEGGGGGKRLVWNL